MPLLNRDLIRGWLEDRNWSMQRLADECLGIDPDDDISEGVMRNAVNGHDPMRPGRIRLIVKVTEKYGSALSYEHLVVAEDGNKDGEQDGPKEEPTAPPKRTNGKGTGPKRLRGAA